MHGHVHVVGFVWDNRLPEIDLVILIKVKITNKMQ
jgi:hypothetical protein